MNQRILTTRVSSQSLVTLRDRARQIGELFGLDKLHRTQFITAVSEIARNTVQFAGEGTICFMFRKDDALEGAQFLVAQVTDRGPGIADIERVLAGRPNGTGHIPLGILGSKRLVDNLTIQCPPEGGTVVDIEMALPKETKKLTGGDLASLVDQLARRKPQTPVEELEQQNREMLHTLEELRLRQLDLEKADERKNHFLGTLAHELRNPLGTLHMTLEIIRRKVDIDRAELEQRRSVMARQIEHLTRLVDDLMDVSRVSGGKVQLDKTPAEVNDLVGQAVEMTGAAIKAKRHEVTIRRHAGELWIRGDITRLKQVLCNLIHNSVRYTPESGRIAISIRQEDASAVVEVADTGIGISAEMLPFVFDMFVQAPTGRGGNGGGLGVGLTLVRRLVEDHGGTVSASSAGAGQGSQFTVTFPLTPHDRLADPG